MLAPSTLKHDATAAARAAEADEQHGGEDAVTTERPRKHDISSLRARGSVSNSPFRSLMLKGSSGTWKEEVSNVKPPNPKLVDPQPPWKDSKPKALDMERCRAASATPYTSSSTSSAKHSPRLKDFKNGSVRGNPFVLADRGTGGKTGETMKAEPSHLRDWRSRSSSALPENSSAASTPPPVPHTISDTRQRNRLSLPDMWKGKTTEGNETPKAPEVVPGLSSSEGFWPIRKDSFGVAVGAKYLESVNAKKKSGSSRRSLDVAMFKPPDETEIGSKGAGVEEPVPLRLGSDETETVPTESNVEIPNSISIAGDQTSAEVESSSHLAADASSLASPDVSNDAPDRAPDAASVEDVTLVSTSTPPEMSADIEQKDHLLDSSPDEAAETFPVVADEDTSKVGTAADDNRHEAGVSKLGRVPSSAKQAFKRIWSPTRLQVPSVSAIFDDPDWLHAILGSNKSAAANATSPVTPTTSPTSAIAEASPRTSLSTMVPAVNLPPPPNTPPSIVRPPTPPLTSHQPMPPPDTVFPPPAAMTSGSDGTQQTPKDDTSDLNVLLSCTDSLEADFDDDGFDEDFDYRDAVRNPPKMPSRVESLTSIVDDIIGEMPRKRASIGKSVRFGRAWNGELESKRLIFEEVARAVPPSDARIGMLYLRINTLDDAFFRSNSDIEVTLNIRQQKADRQYEFETTRILSLGETDVDFDLECEMPLLPTHPVSLVFYFKALSNPLSQGSAYTTSTPSASASATNLLAPIAKFATAPRRNSLMSFFRGGRSSSDETVVDSNNSSFSKPLPALPSGSPRRSTSGPDFMTSNLLVAEAEPTQSEWAEILQSATGTLIAPELELRTLEWKGGMVHGECVGKISCLIGFLPFMEEKVPRSFFPTTYAEYQMAVRITDWNQALSMEGHLWQLGGDVRKHYRRRYYRLTGAELHVYEAAPLPFVTGISWDESDFDPKTELPAPLEQSHGKHLLTIELAHCENWYAFSPIGQRYRTSSGGPTNASDDGSEPSQSDAAFNERDKLPDQRAAFVLLFKDGREIIFGIDPDEVERYQQESNKMLRSSETIRRECDGDGTQPALVEWQSSDIADMWKQALNEVLNGVKYETPLWWDALRASKGERKSEQLSEEAYELASRS